MIIERMNNIPKEDILKYKESFDKLVKFLEYYLPKNFKFTFTPIGSFYEKEEFEKDLEDKINKKKIEFGGLPVLDDKKRSMVELNVKLNPGQDNDPLWKEKIELLHQAYFTVDKRRPYNRAINKILVFPTKIKDGVAVGTTKNSVAKFWVGVGVLKMTDDNFIESILSPSQLNACHFQKETISINGLDSKNFKSIRIIA